MSTAASVSEIVSPGNAARPPASRTAPPEGPDVGTAVHGLPRACSGAHVGGSARMIADLVNAGGREGWRLRGIAGPAARVGSSALARPKSRTLTVPSRDLDVRRLEVAMDDAAFVGRLERVGDLHGDRQRLVERERARRDAVGQALAFDQLHHEERRVSRLTRPCPRSRGSRRCSDDSAPRARCASRSNRASRSGSGEQRRAEP